MHALAAGTCCKHTAAADCKGQYGTGTTIVQLVLQGTLPGCAVPLWRYVCMKYVHILIVCHSIDQCLLGGLPLAGGAPKRCDLRCRTSGALKQQLCA